MQIDSNKGLLHGVRFLNSPHQNDRPDDITINLLVIHCISLPPNQFGGDDIIDLFCGHLDTTKHSYYKSINTQVSAHVFIRRTGEIIQFVPFNKRAWHAGVSEFAGRKGCNDFSIGIELEGAIEIPYEAIQYEKLVVVTKAIMQAYPAITEDRITGHSNIAPERKSDPGEAFDWKKYREMLMAKN